jgi:flagellar assembly factor FliW
MQFELKQPLFGFEAITHMKLTKIDDYFMQLSNVTDENPSFTLINPYILKEYEIEIPQTAQTLLDISDETNVLIFNIVIIHKPLDESTINFTAPLIFNADNQTMCQVILEGKSAQNQGMAEPISNFMNN